MTQNKAIRFAISTSQPITHANFSKRQFVRYRGQDLIDENGSVLKQLEFWTLKKGESWEDNWEPLYNQAK